MKNAQKKLQPGTYYAKQDWDREITIIGIVDGMAVCNGWKISYEPIKVDSQGTEYIQIEERTYSANNKI